MAQATAGDVRCSSTGKGVLQPWEWSPSALGQSFREPANASTCSHGQEDSGIHQALEDHRAVVQQRASSLKFPECAAPLEVGAHGDTSARKEGVAPEEPGAGLSSAVLSTRGCCPLFPLLPLPQARMDNEVLGYKDLAAIPKDKAILDIERPDLMIYEPHFTYSLLDHVERPRSREVRTGRAAACSGGTLAAFVSGLLTPSCRARAVQEVRSL